jgi:hypothetical protein
MAKKAIATKSRLASNTNEVVANSWGHLHELLFSDSWNEQIKRFRSKHAFRGVTDANYKLDTSLKRLGGPYRVLEDHIVRAFMKYAHNHVVEGSFWYWLSVAQHHGLPTRLLDWSYSPLVALHFAVSDTNTFDRDGAIWKVDYAGTHEMLPYEIAGPLKAAGAQIFTVELLSRSLRDLNQLDGHSSPVADYAIFFEPPSLDARIVNQFAYFSIITNPEKSIDDWLQNHPDLWLKIVIPKELKWEVRDKLDQSNITERVLFPGLDGLSQWLKRHYTPRL